MKKQDFDKRDWSDFKLKEISLWHLKRALCAASKRMPSEIWTVGAPDKAAKILFNWSEGTGLTPPFIKYWRETDCIIFEGGNHRAAVVNAIGAKTMPVYIRKTDLSEVCRLLKGKIEDLAGS